MPPGSTTVWLFAETTLFWPADPRLNVEYRACPGNGVSAEGINGITVTPAVEIPQVRIVVGGQPDLIE